MPLTALAYSSNQRHRNSTTFSPVYDRRVNVYYHLCKTFPEKQNYFTTEFSSGTLSVLQRDLPSCLTRAKLLNFTVQVYPKLICWGDNYLAAVDRVLPWGQGHQSGGFPSFPVRVRALSNAVWSVTAQQIELSAPRNTLGKNGAQGLLTCRSRSSWEETRIWMCFIWILPTAFKTLHWETFRIFLIFFSFPTFFFCCKLVGNDCTHLHQLSHI